MLLIRYSASSDGVAMTGGRGNIPVTLGSNSYDPLSIYKLINDCNKTLHCTFNGICRVADADDNWHDINENLIWFHIKKIDNAVRLLISTESLRSSLSTDIDVRKLLMNGKLTFYVYNDNRHFCVPTNIE